MRAAVTRGGRSDGPVDRRAEPPQPGPARCSCAARPSASADPTTTSFSASFLTQPAGSPFPRIQGHEVAARRSRRSGRAAAGAGGRPARRALAAARVRALLPVQRRTPQHVRQLHADRDPPRRRPPAAPGHRAGAGLPDQGRRAPRRGDGRAAVGRRPAVHRARIESGEHVVVLGAGRSGSASACSRASAAPRCWSSTSRTAGSS